MLAALPVRQHIFAARRPPCPPSSAQLQPRPLHDGNTPPRISPPQRAPQPQHKTQQPTTPQPQRRHQQRAQPEQIWGGARPDEVASMSISTLENELRVIVRGTNIWHVPKEVAAAAVERVAAARQEELKRCSAMVVSMLVWEVFLLYEAGAVSREQALPAMQVLATRAADTPMSLFKPIDVAQISLNLAKFGLVDAIIAKWFDRLAAGEAMGLNRQGVRGAKGVEQSIANTIYSLALAGCSEASCFIDHLLAIALTKCTITKSQHSSNIMWGLAKLQHPLDSPQLLAATGHKDAASLMRAFLENSVLPVLSVASGQNVANTLYALALLPVPCEPHAVAALVDRMLEVIKAHKFKVQEVASCAWSCVKLGHRLSDEATLQFVDALVQDTSANSPRDMASMMWTLATGGYSAAALVMQSPLLAFLKARSAQFDGMDISNVAVALAKLGHHNPELFNALVAAAKPKIKEFDNQATANLLWSLAVLEPTTYRSFFKEVEPVLRSRLPSMDAQTVANSAWAYAVVLGDGASKELALGIFRAAGNLGDRLGAPALPQLFQLMAVSSRRCRQQWQLMNSCMTSASAAPMRTLICWSHPTPLPSLSNCVPYSLHWVLKSIRAFPCSAVASS
jgi:hypothetical protein